MTRSARLLACAVAAFALLRGWPALTSGYEGPYDEGNTLCAATRVLAGETPYRDFWSLHPPGTTWLLAGAFRVFGATLGVERAVKLGVVALAAVLVFLLARLAARTGWAAAAALLFIVLPTQTLSLRSRDAGLVLVLATLLAACRPTDRPRRRALVAGLLAGLTFWFKQDFVGAAAVAGAIAVGTSAALSAPAGRKLRAALFDALVPFTAGLAAGLATLAAVLAVRGTFKEFFEQAILFPTASFARFRSIPLSLRFEQLADAVGEGISSKGSLQAALVPVLFVAVLVAAVAGIAWRGRLLRRGFGGAASCASALLASSVAGLLLLAAPWQRADLEHLNPALALALVVLAALVGPREPAGAPRLLAAVSAAAFGAIAFLALAAPSAARGVAIPPDLVEAARFVAANSSPGERIFVGNDRHDRLGYNAPLVYFLAGRPNATRYDNLHPGVATTRAVQEEIVRSLEASGARWIVLWEGPPPGEPNESSLSSGVVVLDEWIVRRAREAARFGSTRVMRIEEPATRR
ncbi:MAG: glycosyltransferase family 39 protein [Acidobacteriota bacterium]